MKYTEKGLALLLRKRYELPAYAVFEQVRSATGAVNARTIDAVIASLWPTNGLHLHAVEIKVSRADFLREIATPSKAETFGPYCHKFWLCAPREVARIEELPAGWGWLCPHADGQMLRIEREAVLHPAEPCTAERLAGLLRAAARDAELWVPKAELQALVDSQVAEQTKGVQERADLMAQMKLNATTRDYKDLRESVQRFEEATGLQIGLAYTFPKDLGEVLKGALYAHLPGQISNAERLVKQLQSSVETMTAGLDKYRALAAVMGKSAPEGDEGST